MKKCLDREHLDASEMRHDAWAGWGGSSVALRCLRTLKSPPLSLYWQTDLWTARSREKRDGRGRRKKALQWQCNAPINDPAFSALPLDLHTRRPRPYMPGAQQLPRNAFDLAFTRHLYASCRTIWCAPQPILKTRSSIAVHETGGGQLVPALLGETVQASSPFDSGIGIMSLCVGSNLVSSNFVSVGILLDLFSLTHLFDDRAFILLHCPRHRAVCNLLFPDSGLSDSTSTACVSLGLAFSEDAQRNCLFPGALFLQPTSPKAQIVPHNHDGRKLVYTNSSTAQQRIVRTCDQDESAKLYCRGLVRTEPGLSNLRYCGDALSHTCTRVVVHGVRPMHRAISHSV
ncbi:hypothetical protein DFH06DRAFT_1308222 [Mycena polygramma]|nr:hypothetical protein DFH06DRAFT_1308222 [Mycena polygramma]